MVDVGPATSIVFWSTLKWIMPWIAKRHLKLCPLILRDYQGSSIPIMGSGKFRVQFKKFSGHLLLVVIYGSLPSLLRLNCFEALRLTKQGINSINSTELKTLIKEFPTVFNGKLGTYTGTPISFNLNPQVAPHQLKPLKVSFALKLKVDAELNRLITQGILEPVDHVRWQTPIVTPIKANGVICICADFKCTLNCVLQAYTSSAHGQAPPTFSG